MAWQYWVRTADADSGEWIDTAATMSKVELTWNLNATCTGKAVIPPGVYGPRSDELLAYWKRYGAALYAMEDGQPAWGAICNAANPSANGLDLTFASTMGWLASVPFVLNYATWQVPATTILEMLVAHSQTFGVDGRIWPISVDGGITAQVGDPEPDTLPIEPIRPPDTSVEAWEESPAYVAWQFDMAVWHEANDSKEPYKIQWWNAPYVGREIDDLVKATGGNYRENFFWSGPGTDIDNVLEFDNYIGRERNDFVFEDGVNIMQPIDTKDNVREFAQRVLALGAGEKETTLLADVAVPDLQRYYQGYWGNYKNINDLTTLQTLATQVHGVTSNQNPVIDNLIVRDVANSNSARVSSLRVGDIVPVVSRKTYPRIDQMCRITKITRQPEAANIVNLAFEVIGV